MVKYENQCYSCGQTCINCGLKRVPVLVCDECGQEVERLFKAGNVQICAECILEQYEEVET